MPLIDTSVPLIAVSCLAQSWSELSTLAAAETYRTIAIASYRSLRVSRRRYRTSQRPLRRMTPAGHVDLGAGYRVLEGFTFGFEAVSLVQRSCSDARVAPHEAPTEGLSVVNQGS